MKEKKAVDLIIIDSLGKPAMLFFCGFKEEAKSHAWISVFKVCRVIYVGSAYSRRTIASYLHWIKYFILYHNKQHPKDLRDTHIEQFLTFCQQQALSMLGVNYLS